MVVVAIAGVFLVVVVVVLLTVLLFVVLLHLLMLQLSLMVLLFEMLLVAMKMKIVTPEVAVAILAIVYGCLSGERRSDGLVKETESAASTTLKMFHDTLYHSYFQD